MIAEEGKRARREAESELTAMEERLKQALAAATSGETAPARRFTTPEPPARPQLT